MKKSKSFVVHAFLLAMAIFGFSPFIRGAEATTYYVSPSGSDSNSGSQSAPFATIQQGADVAQPGDTVIVENGTYNTYNSDGYAVVVNNGGSASGGYVTFEAQNQYGAVLDGQSNTGSVAFMFGNNASYVKIIGFEIKGFQTCGIDIPYASGGNNSTYVWIQGNLIHDIGDGSWQADIGVAGVCQGGSELFIVDNIFHDIGRDGGWINGYPVNDHGLYLTGQNIVVAGNVFYNFPGGWHIQIQNNNNEGNNIAIINNTFYGGCGGGSYDAGQIVLSGISVTDLVFQNNISYDANATFVWSYGATGSGVVFNNNQVYPSSNALISDVNGGGSLPSYTVSGNISGGTINFQNTSSNPLQLELLSGSSGIGAGLAWSGAYDFAYTQDINGNALNSPPDIGSYAYGSSAVSTGVSGTGTGSTGGITNTTGSSGGTGSTGGITNTTGSGGSSGGSSLGSTTLPSGSGSTVTISTGGSGSSGSGSGSSSTGGNVIEGNATGAGVTNSTGTSSSSTTLAQPNPISPVNDETTGTTVTFEWNTVSGNGVTYQILLSTNSQFTNSTSVSAAAATVKNKTYAGLSGIFLFGFVFSIGMRRRKKLLLLLAGIVLSAMFLVSCGGGGSSSTQSGSGATGATTAANAASYTVSGLSDNTTYYWKVVATDSTGQQSVGQVGTFTTN